MLFLLSFINGKTFNDGFRILGVYLCKVIYWLIANLYELFMNLASVQLLQESSLRPIYQRVTLMLAIIMVFYVTFQTVKYVIEPDTVSDKETGASNIVKRMIIVVVLIAMVPKIFSMAYTLQNSLIKNQIFSKLVLGKEQIEIDSFGKNFSANVFNMFYFVDSNFWENPSELKCGSHGPCTMLVNMNITTLQSKGTLTYLDVGINDTASKQDPSGESQDVYGITFEWLLAVGVGGFICYMLILYCIDAGTRIAQLAYLQIIAPIPIIGYIIPKKDGIFDKWLKQCITTYLDLFIRVTIIYMILLVVDVLGDAYKNHTLINGVTTTGWMNVFMYTAMIMGLFVFAKRAPELLQELFPSMGKASGTFGLSLKQRTEGLTSFVKGTGKVVGGVAKTIGTGRRLIGATGGYLLGFASGGGFRGARESAKTAWDKNQKGLLRGSAINRIRKGVVAGAKVRENRKDVKAAGGTAYGSEHRQEHFQNVAQAQDRHSAKFDDMIKSKKGLSDAITDLKFMKQIDTMGESISKVNPTAGKDWTAVKKEAEKVARKYLAGDITEAELQQRINTKITDFNNNNFPPIPNAPNPNAPNPNAASIIDPDAFEIGSANWGKAKTAYNQAKDAAKAIDGETWVDKEGHTQKIEYKESTFADDIGDIEAAASAAKTQFENSKEWHKAHTNAKGSENSKK